MTRGWILTAAVMLAGFGPASAQGVRGTAVTTFRFAEIRPLQRDTAAAAAEPVSALILSQDIGMTAWGLGAEGLSATVLIRGRAELGGDFGWPRYDDPFDAILAYAELGRERYRVRVGRQRNLSGLGFTSFDGVSGRYEAGSRVHVEAYGGRSLGRGVESPRHQALEAFEDFLPDAEAVLIGAAAAIDAGRGVSAAVRAQTEFWADGSGMLSERASLDVQAAALGPLEGELAADYDIAFQRLGSTHLTLRYPLPAQRLTLEATARRYRPFFELWTIWGFFSPVGYNEAEVQAAWRPAAWADVAILAGVRRYEETDADVFLEPPADDARRVTLRSRVRLPRGFDVNAEYRLEHGFGAYLNSGELTAGWAATERLRLTGYSTAFQQIMEFRTGDVMVLGFGGGADFALTDRIEIGAGATLYRQDVENRPSATDWNQKRAWAIFEYRFGSDPGRAGGLP